VRKRVSNLILGVLDRNGIIYKTSVFSGGICTNNPFLFVQRSNCSNCHNIFFVQKLMRIGVKSRFVNTLLSHEEGFDFSPIVQKEVSTYYLYF